MHTLEMWLPTLHIFEAFRTKDSDVPYINPWFPSVYLVFTYDASHQLECSKVLLSTRLVCSTRSPLPLWDIGNSRNVIVPVLSLLRMAVMFAWALERRYSLPMVLKCPVVQVIHTTVPYIISQFPHLRIWPFPTVPTNASLLSFCS